MRKSTQLCDSDIPVSIVFLFTLPNFSGNSHCLYQNPNNYKEIFETRSTVLFSLELEYSKSLKTNNENPPARKLRSNVNHPTPETSKPPSSPIQVSLT